MVAAVQVRGRVVGLLVQAAAERVRPAGKRSFDLLAGCSEACREVTVAAVQIRGRVGGLLVQDAAERESAAVRSRARPAAAASGEEGGEQAGCSAKTRRGDKCRKRGRLLQR